MRVILIIFLSISSLSVFSFEYIHCDISKLQDKIVQQQTTRNFCSKNKKNQHDVQYGEIALSKNWNLVIFSEYPTIKWKMISYDDVFLTSDMYLKMGSRFDIVAKGIKIFCKVDGNKCRADEMPMYSNKILKLSN